MTLLSIVLKNLARRPVRSALTVLGVGIGIGAVVSLTSLVWGFERSWEAVNRARGTDLVVIRGGSRSLLPTPFAEMTTGAVASIESVAGAAGVLNDVMSIEESPAVLVHGWRPGSFLWEHLTLRRGRWPGADEQAVVLGTIAAETLGKSVGDALQVDIEEFRVCGVFDSTAASERTAVVMPLARLQALTSRPGMVNLVNVRVRGSGDAASVEQVRQRVSRALGGGFRVLDATDAAHANLGLGLAKAVSVGTSAIAVLVGAVGMMNTMLMSVFERLHEIGVLLAVGWKRRRIVTMILLESLLLGVAGALAGLVMGLAGVRLLLATPALRGQIDLEVRPLMLLATVAVALAVGAAGGIYPAWRGSRMAPADALRHE